MKKFFLFLFLFAVGIALTYLVGALANASFNPTQWDKELRETMALMGGGGSIVVAWLLTNTQKVPEE